ncbi:hypothetical protein KVV02_007616 [Mortierella alpina]|uniref:Uncharacterized protein n=1 Tax=Mortierella alpina TaxID=64518 RepID=A0A9P8A1J1_MORAP|nr:hypothetical protein KVV02_007616 [Mortierella alpina]
MATTLVNFLSQHIHIPLSPSGRDQDHDYFVRTPQQQPLEQQQQLPHQSPDKPRVYSVFSELRTLEQQSHSALEQFPCEDRHSFNPHYQHNLLTSSANSTPSLFSTSANSSASSYSSSSTFSLSRATGTRALGHESSQQSQTISSGAGGRQNYSSYHHYHHHKNPRRFARLQQQQDRGHDDWMFGISDDDDIRAASTSPSGPCMGRVHPQNAPICPPSLSSAASLRSSLVRRSRPQRGTVTSDTFLTESQIKKQRSMVTFSSVILQHPPCTEQPSTALPSISESSQRSLASNSSATAFEATPSGRVDCHQESSPARQSLMRIAQMSKDQDGWCSQNAGQYTHRYAEARPRGMMLDGRRSCRR